jgi:hypothetical protein
MTIFASVIFSCRRHMWVPAAVIVAALPAHESPALRSTSPPSSCSIHAAAATHVSRSMHKKPATAKQQHYHQEEQQAQDYVPHKTQYCDIIHTFRSHIADFSSEDRDPSQRALDKADILAVKIRECEGKAAVVSDPPLRVACVFSTPQHC